VAAVVTRSRHDWVVCTHHLDPDSTFHELGEVPIVELSPRVAVTRSLPAVARAGATIASARLPLAGVSALLVSAESLGELTLVRNRVPAAAYCHTPLKILHDPATRRALRSRSPLHASAVSILGPGYASVQRRLWRRFRHVFVNSWETGDRLRRAGLSPEGGFEVLHPGVDTDKFTPGPARADQYFLVAGRLMWEKEIEFAIDAFALACEWGLRSRLIVAGAVDVKSKPYLRHLQSLARNLPVAFESDPSDARLQQLYQGAQALVFPPPSEDFGIVPLEAMACGVPVIARDAGGPRETVVDKLTGWLLPSDPAAFATRMLAVETAGPRLGAMRRAARARAHDFSWSTLVNRIDTVMEALATGAPAPALAPPPPEGLGPSWQESLAAIDDRLRDFQLSGRAQDRPDVDDADARLEAEPTAASERG
jgi:glycosyltransferase involved in cell wall biosynthesis